MTHFSGLNLERFRRFNGLHLESLRQFNLLVGPNSSGKTSVLEALAIACSPFDLKNWAEIAWEREARTRRTDVAEALRWFFPASSNGDKAGREETLSLVCEGGKTPGRLLATYSELLQLSPEAANDLERRRIRLRIGTQNGPTPEFYRELAEAGAYLRLKHPMDSDPMIFELGYTDRPKVDAFSDIAAIPYSLITPVSHRTHDSASQLTEAIERDLKLDVAEALRRIDPSICELEIVSPTGKQPMVKVRHLKEGLLPLSAEGDGIRRFVTLATAALTATRGVLLIDEIETAFHTSVLAEAFRHLMTVCRKHDVQLFATTHSLEAIDGIIEGAGASLDELAIFRLPAIGTNHPVKRFDGNLARSVRSEHGSDLR